ncbi:MAG: hypothetical protein ACLFWD_09255 [Anaerolineales bacterium]
MRTQLQPIHIRDDSARMQAFEALVGKSGMTLGIACSAGGYRGAFSHGVLAAFEAAGLRARIYAAASSTVVPSAYAAAGGIGRLAGPEYWIKGWRIYQQTGSMSQSFKQGLAEYSHWLKRNLFRPEAARMIIPANRVVGEGAAERSQGAGFLRLGRELLLMIRHADASWADRNLELVCFDSRSSGPHRELNPTNLEAVCYASSRYLHSGWNQPAWIDGEPYIDAVYTAGIPIKPLLMEDFSDVVVIHHEPEWPYLDFFRSEILPEELDGPELHVLGPEGRLAEIEVEVMHASEEGLAKAFELGHAQGDKLLQENCKLLEVADR